MDISASPSGSAIKRPNVTIRLPEILRLLWRRSPLIVLCAIIGAAAAFGFAKTRTPRYSAFATIAIEGQTFAIPQLEGAVRDPSTTDPMPLVRTELQAVMSRQLVQSVITKLGMDRLPEFNAALRPPSLLHKARVLVEQMLPGQPPSPASPDAITQAVLDGVMQAMVITQDNRSFVIGVSFSSEDPRLASAFVNTLIENYLASRTQRRITANHDANTEMLQRVETVRLGLSKLEQQMRDLRTSGNLVGLRAGSIGQQQVEDLATAASRASLERAELEAQWQRASALSKQGSSSDLASVLNSPTITRLRDLESQASQHLADLTAHYGPNYPGVRSAQADLQAARSQVANEARRIVSSLSAQLTVARAHEADTKQQLQSAREAGVKAENAQAGLNDLQQEINTQRTLYQSLLEGEQRTITQPAGAGPPVDVRVLSAAETPAFPSSPNTKLAAGSGGFGGAVIGLLFALVRNRNQNVLSTADDVTATTGLPVMTLTLNRRGKQTVLAAARADPAGPVAEGLRLLRAQLQGRGPLSTTRSVMFASLDGDKAAADVAAAFAYIAAGDGEKVVLAEGDLREPRVAQMFDLQQSSLLTVLEGNEDWRDVLLRDRSAQLDFLVTQQAASRSHALLSGTRFQNLLVDLHETYNLTVFSGPAVTSADTLTLASEVQATVLVMRSAKATRPAVAEAADRLSAVCRNRLIVALIEAR